MAKQTTMKPKPSTEVADEMTERDRMLPRWHRAGYYTNHPAPEDKARRNINSIDMSAENERMLLQSLKSSAIGR